MNDLTRLRLRHALVRHLGRPLLPAAAADIETTVLGGKSVAGEGTRIVTDAWRVLDFLKQHISIGADEFMRGIGLERDGRMVAGVLYVSNNGSSICTHIAGEPGARWMTRAYLHAIFHYPFCEVGVNQILCWVEHSNAQSRRFVEHLGFTLVAKLPSAGKNNADVLIYRMTKEECRYA